RLQGCEGGLCPHPRGPRKFLGGHGRNPRRRGRLRACRHGQELHRFAGPDGHWQGGVSSQYHLDRQRAGVLRADLSGVAAARSAPELRLAFVVQREARLAPGSLAGQASARTYRRGGRARSDNPLGFRPGIMTMHAKERVSDRWLIAIMCTMLQLCLGTVYACSYFQTLLVELFRWTNTETWWDFSLTICCLGHSAAWGGITLARIGPRKLAVAGALLFAAGYALAAVALAVKSLTLFYLGYGA